MGAIIGRMVGIIVEQFVYNYNDVLPAFLQVSLSKYGFKTFSLPLNTRHFFRASVLIANLV